MLIGVSPARPLHKEFLSSHQPSKELALISSTGSSMLPGCLLLVIATGCFITAWPLQSNVSGSPAITKVS